MSSKIDELRAGLVERADVAEKRIIMHRENLAKLERDHMVAIECLRVHDETMVALGVDRGDLAPAAGDERGRRNIGAEVEARLGETPLSVDALVEKIGGVRVTQVDAALAKLKGKNKAWFDDGLWHLGPEPVPYVPVGEPRAEAAK